MAQILSEETRYYVRATYSDGGTMWKIFGGWQSSFEHKDCANRSNNEGWLPRVLEELKFNGRENEFEKVEVIPVLITASIPD